MVENKMKKPGKSYNDW